MTDNDLKPDSLAYRLRLAREQSGLTQGQVAKLLSLHRPSISEIEAGRRKVSAYELQKFAKAYGVSVEWLADGTIRNQEDPTQARVQLAARELAKLNQEDLDRLLGLLASLKRSEEDGS